MFNKYKYLELNRHHLFTKTKTFITEHHKHEDDGYDKISEVIFSSALSLFLAYLSETYFIKYEENSQLPTLKVIGLFILSIIIYCILYITIRKIYSIVSKKIKEIIYNKKTHSVDISAQRIKELVDDFDNVAFDNLLISKEFLSEIEKIGDKDLETTTFYFHESIYYLRIALNKTKNILHDDVINKTINIYENSNGVDVFRLINAHSLMECVITKIKELSDKDTRVQTYDAKLKDVLNFQINELEIAIKEIGETCNNVTGKLNHIY